MSKEDLERRAASVRSNRKVAETKHATKAAEGEANTEKFRILWNAAAPGYLGAWGGHYDMMQATVKLTVLNQTVEDIPAFLEWVVTEWRSLKFRSGTRWMFEKDMLPRHPTMRFVLHHWSHFHASYIDRAQDKAHDYVDPEVDALREDLAFLEAKLQEVAKFGPEAQLLKARILIETLERENQRLRALFAPFVDLDTDLPTWEEKENGKI
jgi:hypothetical protein